MKTVTLISALLLFTAAAAAADTPRSTRGTLTSVTVLNLEETRGLTKAEKEYPVHVTISTAPGIVFGFTADSSGDLSAADSRMFELLQIAFEKNLQVAVRWETDVVYQKKKGPTRARILGVTISR